MVGSSNQQRALEQTLKCLWGRETHLKPTAFTLAWESQMCQPHIRFTNALISISVCMYYGCIYLCAWIYAYLCQFTLCYSKEIPETGWFKRFIFYRSGAGKLLAKNPISGEGLGAVLLPGYSLVGCWKSKNTKTSFMIIALFYSIRDSGSSLKSPTFNTCTGIKFQHINFGGCIQTTYIHATTHLHIYEHTIHNLFCSLGTSDR